MARHLFLACADVELFTEVKKTLTFIIAQAEKFNSTNREIFGGLLNRSNFVCENKGLPRQLENEIQASVQMENLAKDSEEDIYFSGNPKMQSEISQLVQELIEICEKINESNNNLTTNHDKLPVEGEETNRIEIENFDHNYNDNQIYFKVDINECHDIVVIVKDNVRNVICTAKKQLQPTTSIKFETEMNQVEYLEKENDLDDICRECDNIASSKDQEIPDIDKGQCKISKTCSSVECDRDVPLSDVDFSLKDEQIEYECFYQTEYKSGLTRDSRKKPQGCKLRLGLSKKQKISPLHNYQFQRNKD